ncbi:HAD-IA family hydrolase [Allosalinactinospora lopnorensis]|uniref:HAD-IA family hydrolase n=1 Tax=Allosalinactinospora lopnorensis TaxID=1352348 RepID=UPI000A810A1F
MRHWFDHVLRDAFVLAASGGYRPFRDVAISALHDVTGHRLPQGAAEELISAMAALDARADAAPAMRRVRDAGVAVLTLTNGAAETTRRLLDGAGLSDHVQRVISIDEVGRGKPAPEPYRYAAEACGVAPHRLALVAAHGWDVHGARSAGLTTGWSSHLEGRFPAVFDPADVMGTDLVSVVDGLLEL